VAMPKSAPFQVAAKRACAAYSPIQPSAFRIQHFPRPRVPVSPPHPLSPSACPAVTLRKHARYPRHRPLRRPGRAR
jgi:hypothetical protein